jgi:predicted transcriptional regulator
MTLISQFFVINVMTYRQRYRDRIDIIGQILDIANGYDTKKTRIMTNAFLSHQQLNQYLRVLTKGDLLRYDGNTQTFKTTEKGIRFLDTLNRMDEMIRAQET